jgi:AcrR family transcriptional regulator
MGRKFSEKEIAFYREKILKEATNLFSILGFKKTSIQDITDAAGIAKGSFYHFFTSKEELLFSILEEQEKFRDNLLADLTRPENSAEFVLKKLLHESLSLTEKNKIFKAFYHENLLEKLYLKLPQKRLEQHFDQDFASSKKFIEYFQTNSNLIETDPKIIVGLLRGFFMLPLHKKEIGEDIYDEVMALMITAISKGLTEVK